MIKNNQIEVPFTSADQAKLASMETGAQANPPISSQAVAEAGVDNYAYMTALRVKQAIDALGGGGGGEVNTGSNVGAGVGVFKSKVGVDLQFKSLVAGSGVTISSGTNTITIAASPGGLTNTDGLAEGATNLYFTNARVASAPAVVANTAKVSADGSVNTHSDVNYSGATVGQVLAWNGTNWTNQTIAGGSGEANTASNVGATGAGTAGVFKAKSGVDLQMRRLIAGTNVTITENTNDITIAATGGGGGGQEVSCLSFDSGRIKVLATGSAADLALISATKNFVTAGVSKLILNRPTTVQYHSVKCIFLASETAGRTQIDVEFPEPNGNTNVLESIRPIGFRLNNTMGVAATGGTISNAAGTMTLTLTGATGGADYGVTVLF